jgi:hypothetical protein
MERADFLSLIDLPMDIYLLSRLFIIFDKKKMNRGPIGCRDQKYREIKNAIVYIGDMHTKFCTRSFSKDFEVNPKIEIINGIYNKCVELEEPFDVFHIDG